MSVCVVRAAQSKGVHYTNYMQIRVDHINDLNEIYESIAAAAAAATAAAIS